MSPPVSLLMVQFLAWVAERPHSYAEAMDAWRSHCPRMTVWEDATIDGLVRLANGADQAVVALTPRGQEVLYGSAELTKANPS